MRRCCLILLFGLLAAALLGGCDRSKPVVAIGPPYGGKGADVVYQLMPSLRHMRVVRSKFGQAKRSAGTWFAVVTYCSVRQTPDVLVTLRKEFAGSGAVEKKDPHGDVLFNVSNPPLGYHRVSAKIYDEKNVLGPHDPRIGAEQTVVDVTVEKRS